MTEDEAIRLALGSDSTVFHRQGDEGYIEGDYPLGWRAPGFKQRFTAVNFNSVLVMDSAQDAGGAWQSVTHQSSANFSVMHVASGALDRFAVFGLTRDKKPVVELWNLVAAAGTVVLHGSSGGTTSPQLVPKGFLKTRIYTGAPNQGAVAFEYDPAARYVVCAIRDPQGEVSLLQINAQNPSTPPVVLCNSTTVPELNDVRYALKADHTALGRVIKFGTAFKSHKRIMLVDASNDGVFDGPPLVGDDAYFAAQGLDTFEDWIDLDH
ncbi:MAG: hypothetical protein IT453_16180 [Planctomycetes bacterium]|nr:hypothetical protein [Planctomycetota bacterium]